MEGYQPAFLILSIIFPILATIAVVLRVQSRRIARQKLGTDDWLILAALLFCYGWCVNIVIDSLVGGLGGHMKFGPHGIPILGPHWVVYKKTNYISVVLAVPTLGLIKLSIAFLYKRIFATYRFQIVSWIVIAILIAWAFSGTLAALLACLPLEYQFTHNTNGKCVDLGALYTAGVATNTAVDIIVILVPVYNVWNLQMPFRRKVGVCAIFALGGFVIIAGILRMIYVVHAYNALKNPLYVDVTYIIAPAIIWTIVELNLGVVCACLPLLRPVWTAYGMNSFVNTFFSGIGISSRSPSSKGTLPSFIKKTKSQDDTTRTPSERSGSSKQKFNEEIMLYSIEDGAALAYPETVAQRNHEVV